MPIYIVGNSKISRKPHRVFSRGSFLLILLLLLLGSCSERVVEGGRIIVKNDILDKKYNSFTVDRVISSRGATAFRRSLSPGDEVVLPIKNIRSLRFTRQYADHSMIYIVSCPKDFSREVRMKLIDVHSNRIGGGCSLRKRGRSERGAYVKWE